MIKSKLVALVAATTLAVAPGLVACGGQQQQSNDQATTEETAKTEEAKTEEAKTEIDLTAPVTWGAKGTTDDGMFDVLYTETRVPEAKEGSATLVLRDVDSRLAITWNGPFTVDEDGMCTLTDTATDESITYTDPDADLQTGKITMQIAEYEDATLEMADTETVINDIAEAVKEGDEAIEELSEDDAESDGEAEGDTAAE